METRKDITSTFFSVLLIGVLIYASFTVLETFLPSLIWAAMIVIASWKLMMRVQSVLGGRRSLAVLVMTSFLVLTLILPLTIAFTAIVDNVEPVSRSLHQLSIDGAPPAPEWLEDVPVVGKRIASRWNKAANAGRDELVGKLAPFVGTAFSWFVQQLGELGLTLGYFLLTIVLSAILYFRGESWAHGIRLFARRLASDRGEQAVILAAQAVRAVANGVILTALVQGVLVAIGLAFAGVPYVAILSSLAFFLSVIQVGAAPVLIGAVVWLFHTGATASAWGFLIWSLFVMVSDNLMRPVLIKRGADLPLLLIFAGVIGGIISFGIIGIFVGPVVLAVSYTLLHAWVAEQTHSEPI